MGKLKVRAKKSKKESNPAVNADLMDKPAETKPSYRVESIDNGWIITKEWTDKDGRWRTQKKFMEENPLEKDVMDEEDD